jgi:MoaA/NifB/PqqE/SkfB family radical SAM enzyme
MKRSEKISRSLELLKSTPDVLSISTDVLFGHSQPLKTYIDLFVKLFRIKGLGAKLPVYASADITNACNLKCKHCYWWKNWKQGRELSPEEWRTVIRNKFVKENVYQVALTGGEPLLRPEVIKVFREEVRNNIYVVTNGTLPLIDFNRISYFVSIDGTEKIHNYIRGLKIYKKVNKKIN